MLAFDCSVLVEEKENRGLNCIRVQPVGSRKEYWLRFEVSDCRLYKQNMTFSFATVSP